jgi:pimeloyl-ACP methyl ester carboxylesterase
MELKMLLWNFSFPFQNHYEMTELFVSERGAGVPLVLIHGFPFNHQVWNNFAEKLSRRFRVITIDLPGFGKSSILPAPFSIDDVAKHIVARLKERKIKDFFLAGHSLGGYVALSIANNDPLSLQGLVLFHSTAFADSQEKKQSRDKVLDFIATNGVQAFTSNFITPLFSNPQHPAVSEVKLIAVQSAENAVKGYTVAMRDRPDTTGVLKAFPKPVLFLAGEKDPGIPVESIHKQASLCPDAETHILPGVAHMGMFEDEKNTLSIISSFIEKNTVTK